MQTEQPNGGDLASSAEPPPRTGVRGTGRRGPTGPRVRALWCSILLGGTTLTGLLLHGQTPHGGALDAVDFPGGAIVLLVLHVILTIGLAVAIVLHVVDKRRPMLAIFKRRSRRNLRSLLAYVAFAGLLVASIATGFGTDSRDDVAHHIAISLTLTIIYAWHCGRRVAARRRRASRRVSMAAKS